MNSKWTPTKRYLVASSRICSEMGGKSLGSNEPKTDGLPLAPIKGELIDIQHAYGVTNVISPYQRLIAVSKLPQLISKISCLPIRCFHTGRKKKLTQFAWPDHSEDEKTQNDDSMKINGIEKEMRNQDITFRFGSIKDWKHIGQNIRNELLPIHKKKLKLLNESKETAQSETAHELEMEAKKKCLGSIPLKVFKSMHTENQKTAGKLQKQRDLLRKRDQTTYFFVHDADDDDVDADDNDNHDLKAIPHKRADINYPLENSTEQLGRSTMRENCRPMSLRDSMVNIIESRKSYGPRKVNIPESAFHVKAELLGTFQQLKPKERMETSDLAATLQTTQHKIAAKRVPGKSSSQLNAQLGSELELIRGKHAFKAPDNITLPPQHLMVPPKLTNAKTTDVPKILEKTQKANKSMLTKIKNISVSLFEEANRMQKSANDNLVRLKMERAAIMANELLQRNRLLQEMESEKEEKIQRNQQILETKLQQKKTAEEKPKMDSFDLRFEPKNYVGSDRTCGPKLKYVKNTLTRQLGETKRCDKTKLQGSAALAVPPAIKHRLHSANQFAPKHFKQISKKASNSTDNAIAANDLSRQSKRKYSTKF